MSILDSTKNKLSNELWQNEKMKSSAKSFILSKLKSWLKTITSKEIENIFLLGSMAGYQYNSEADIDINFVIDVSNKRIEEIAKLLPNGINLPGTNHPINYYVANEINKNWDGPVYDILKDKWIRKPKKNSNKNSITNFKAVSEIARFFVLGLNAAITEYEMDISSFNTYKEYYKEAVEHEKKEIEENLKQKKYEILADIDGIYIAKHIIKALRKEAYSEKENLNISTEIKILNNDNKINNLIYKYLEKLDYFEKIDKILKESEKWEKETI